jgi:hypothetical protein
LSADASGADVGGLLKVCSHAWLTAMWASSSTVPHLRESCAHQAQAARTSTPAPLTTTTATMTRHKQCITLCYQTHHDQTHIEKLSVITKYKPPAQAHPTPQPPQTSHTTYYSPVGKHTPSPPALLTCTGTCLCPPPAPGQGRKPTSQQEGAEQSSSSPVYRQGHTAAVGTVRPL